MNSMADKDLKDLNTRIQRIRLVAMDVDGVLTEGKEKVAHGK